MKHPLVAIGYTLLGALAAGVPLVYFAKGPTPRTFQKPVFASKETSVPTPVLVRYTNEPTKICIRHMGKELLKLKPNCQGTWYGTLSLPTISAGKTLELEVQAQWPDPPANQAITIEMMPDGLRTSTDTQWNHGKANELHTIFTFQW